MKKLQMEYLKKLKKILLAFTKFTYRNYIGCYRLFQEDIEKVVALAVLMLQPQWRKCWQTWLYHKSNRQTRNFIGKFAQGCFKEFVIGIFNGIIAISAEVVQFWFKEFDLSILIAVAMILNMIVAGLFGILVPVSLKKFNIDWH